MATNEKTSKRVASKAGHATKDVSILRRMSKEFRFHADNLDAIARRYASVAGSALTQTPDRPKNGRTSRTARALAGAALVLALVGATGCTREPAITEFTVERKDVPTAAWVGETAPDKWDRLQYVCDVATPGPWTSDEQIIDWMGGQFPSVRIGHVTSKTALGETSGPVAMCPAEFGTGQPLSDARFIAAARTALPEAIARIRELEAEIVELKALKVELTTTGDNSPVISGATGSVTIVTDRNTEVSQ